MSELVESAISSIDIEKIERPEASYSMIYVNHSAPLNPDSLPKNLTGIVLESASWDWFEDPMVVLGSLKYREPYIFPHLESRKLPLYLADTGFSGSVNITDNLVVGAEALLGSALAYSAVKDLKQPKTSRREFLKSGIKGMAGLYLLAPEVAGIGRLASSLSNQGHNLSAEALRLSDAVHPEVGLFNYKIRNALLAYKEQRIAEDLGGKQNLATVIGASHVGLSDRLRVGADENIAYLDALRPIIHLFANKNTLPRSIKYEFNGDSWEVAGVTDYPELSALL